MLRSHPTQVFVLKYWARSSYSPAVCLLEHSIHWAQLIILIPVVVGGLSMRHWHSSGA